MKKLIVSLLFLAILSVTVKILYKNHVLNIEQNTKTVITFAAINFNYNFKVY
jgi:hypothetical protein